MMFLFLGPRMCGKTRLYHAIINDKKYQRYTQKGRYEAARRRAYRIEKRFYKKLKKGAL